MNQDHVTVSPRTNVARASRAPVRSRLYRTALAGALLAPILAATPQIAAADGLPDFRTMVEQQSGTVVSIRVRADRTAAAGEEGAVPPGLENIPEEYRRFFEGPNGPGNRGPRRGSGFGSGFIVSADGYILTNAHVVDGATDIRVDLENRRQYEAELVGSDPTTDVALIKIDATDLPAATIGDSDGLAVGEWVLAIGSPFGLEHTATQGIVSALSRSLPNDNYVPFIQTDVAVNPGNSGGPLFNTDGEVVGINSQIYSRSGGYQGLSFAIPINTAMAISEQLRTQGYATRGWLGVTIQDVDQALAESFGLDRPEGALVAAVTKDSPADKAGLETGDIVVALDGTEVPYSNALPPLVGAVVPGTAVELDVLREGERRTIEVTIEPLEEERRTSLADAETEEKAGRLGVAVAEMSDEEREEAGVESGVVVSEVTPGSPADEAGIVPGDVIVSLDRKPVADVETLASLVGEAPGEESVPVLVQRDGAPRFLALTLPAGQG